MPAYSWNYCLDNDDTLLPDADLSAREGWALVNDTTGEARIEKIDALGVLEHDGQAWDIVARGAAQGSEYHAAALEHIRRYGDEGEWERIEAYIRQGGKDDAGTDRPRWDDVVAAVDRFEINRPDESQDAEVTSSFRPAA